METQFIDISHINLPGPMERTMLDESHSSITHERGQLSNEAHQTICRRRELTFDKQGGGFDHAYTPFQLGQARSSSLATLHYL